MKAAATVPHFILNRSFVYNSLLQIFLLTPFIIFLLGDSQAWAQENVILVGSGSTVPAPLYSRWTQEYGKHNARVKMRYLPIGTSEGLKQISHGTGDFGAGEAPLTEKERKEGGLIELPVVLIGIVPIYNLPDLHGELRLSGEVLAEIYLGTVKTWNAAQIAKLNPELSLPNLPIRVIHRPPGKGSNYVFTDFLSRSSERFRSQIGVSPSPKWPVGVPAERSSDMADKVKTESGSIGYVEFQYALKSNISQASVQNGAGKFVKASQQGLTAACESVEEPRWSNFSASLANARGADSYPITSFTWIYLRAQTPDAMRAAAMTDLLSWIYSDGQTFANEEGYAQLPTPLLASVKKRANELH